MTKHARDFSIVKKTFLSAAHFLLELSSSEPLPPIVPGQFCEVLIPHSAQTFLRRPFSIHDVIEETNSIIIQVSIVGAGTQQLSRLTEGQSLNTIFPLGKGFSLAEKGRVLLAGGGCGTAPLLYLARLLYEKNVRLDILTGGRCFSDIHETHEYRKYGELYISTEDGSLGEKGIITKHSILNGMPAYDMVYCCGPEPMMKAVAAWCAGHNTECEVSLENTMACGIGACLCCVTSTNQGNACVCTEGPVFNTKQLLWQT
ncbi:MAG: dihydroorotate dehydrogenase electron transfer subunit [Bacteroidota bacterium]